MKTKTLDYTNSLIASLCSIHCIVLPFVIAILPALGLAWLGSQAFGIWMVLLTAFIGTWAICIGYKEHKKCWPLVWFGFGILALIISEFVLHGMPVQKEIIVGNRHLLVWTKGHPSHHYISAAGGFLIAISHILNQMFCKKCSGCNGHKHSHSLNIPGEVCPWCGSHDLEFSSSSYSCRSCDAEFTVTLAN